MGDLAFMRRAAQLYGCRFVLTQGAVAATAVAFRLVPARGTIMDLHSLMLTVGPDDYSAGEQVSVRIQDGLSAATVLFGYLILKTDADNQRLHGHGMKVLSAITATTVDEHGLPPKAYLAYPDQIYISTSALAQNETVTAAMRCMIFGTEKPLLTKIGADVTLTTEYSTFLPGK